MEKDLAVASKQCVEMAHSRDLMAFRAEDQTSKQLAADLAHKVVANLLDRFSTLSRNNTSLIFRMIFDSIVDRTS